MSTSDTQTLALLISQRRKCLLQLRELGKRQATMIAASDMGALMPILVAKQQLITALQKIEHGLEPFRDEDPNARQWASPEARDKCAAEAEECRALLREVMAAEQQNQDELTVRRDDVAQRLRSVASSQQIRSAYEQQTHGR
ncbi:MAG: hypothetical protein KDA61_11600 [Planctomycetales bacterium]|nr:hypothetical protein [Planctomycetales bacterium]